MQGHDRAWGGLKRTIGLASVLVPCCARSPGYGNVEAREKFVHDFVAAGNKEMNRIALLCVIVEVVKQKPRNDVGAFPM